MADYYINSDKGKELANSLRAGDMAEASDGSTWRKEADGSITVTKNGQTMTGRVGESAPTVSESSAYTPASAPETTVETPVLDAATQNDPANTAKQEIGQTSIAQQQTEQVLASEKARAAVENITAGLQNNDAQSLLLQQQSKTSGHQSGNVEELLNQAIQQASVPDTGSSEENYTIGSAKGVLMTEKMQNSGDMAEGSDGSIWKRNEDGSITVTTKDGKTYTANVDRDAGKRDPQWAALTAPPDSSASSNGAKKSSGGTGGTSYAAASTAAVAPAAQQSAAQPAATVDRATLRKQAATAQKEMGDLARQIQAARPQQRAALQAKYNEAKARYDSATAQINAPKQLTTTAARQEKFDQRQTLIEEATKQAQLQSNLEKAQRDGYNRTVQEKADIYNSVAHDQLSGLNRTIDEKGLSTVMEDQNRGYQRTLQEKQKQIAASIEHDQQSGYKRTEEEKRDKTLGGKLFTMLGAGLGQFNSSIAGLADAAATAVETVGSYLNGGFTKDGKFVKGDAAFTKSLMEPIHTWADYTRNTSDALNEQSARNWNQTAAGSIANTIGTGVIAALPQAALALMTLGTSSAGTLTQASSGLAGSIETAMQRIANDPSYWLSFMQETGSNFTEAKAAGATDEEAVLSATIAGLANAAIEVGGGLENNDWMNDGTLSALSKAKNLVKGAVEEGSEELIQNPISRAMQKLVYDGDRQWLSFDNTAQGRDAVFNPYQSAEEFATGAAVGGILGAGNFALSRAMNARAQNTGNTNADTDVLLDQAIQDASRPDTVQNAQLTQDEILDAAMRAANRGETLTAPVQAANQNTQQTTRATQERGAGDVITGSETNKNVPAYTETESTAVNDNPAVHTSQEQRLIEEYKSSTDESLKETFQSYLENPRQGFSRHNINDVSERQAADASKLLGGDYTGYKNAINSNGINHILNEHGPFGEVNQSMADLNDPARVGYVLRNYDTVERATYRSGAADSSAEFRDANNNPAPMLKYSKKVNGTYYVVEAIPESKYKKFWVVSAYMEADGGTQAPNAVRPGNTSGTSLASSPSAEFSVPQSSNPVNQNVSANDMGAMRSQFESVPKQSQTQSNTISSMEADWNVPESQRTPIMYDTISEAKSLDNARLRLAQDYAGEMAELRGKHIWSGEEVDMGMMILDNYRRAAEQTGDWTQYMEWKKATVGHGNEIGRALQAYAKYSRQTGGGIVADASVALERAAKRTNKAEIMSKVNDLANRYDSAIGTGQENAKVDVNDLVDIIKSASTTRQTGTLIGNKTPAIVNWAMNRIADYARSEAQSGGGKNLDFLKTFAANSIYDIAADTQTVSAGEKVKSVRRVGMLSKVATVMRNLASNNVFDPIDSVARDISVPLDMLVSKITGTRSVAGDASWFSAAKRKGSMDGLARSVMEVGLDVDTSGGAGKYENTANRTFKMSGGVFSKLMSVWEAYEGYTLNATDEFQKGGIEASVQQGIDRLYEQGKIRDDSLRDAGKQEALYRTFQDKTVLSDAAIGIRNALNKAHIGDIGAGDIVLPFAQVPSNLGARAIEYSPAGFGVAAADFINLIDAAQKGNFTAAQQAKAVQGVGRALTGSGMIAIAAAGALRGWLKVTGDDEDKNKDALGKTHGLDGTQLNISAALRDLRGESAEWRAGDQLLSIGFLDPLNAQLTTGALIADDIRSENVTAGRVLGNSFSGALQSVLDTPVMSTLQDVANNYQYSDASTPGGKVMDAAQKYAANQISSVIPNSLRGIAQGLDDTERNAYSSDNIWQQALDNAKASIPGLRETLPAKTDVWGNPVKNEGGLRNFLNRNINPGNITTYKTDEVSSELEKISDATNTSLYPDRTAPRSLKVNGEAVSLTFEQRSMYQKAYGDAYYAAVTSLMGDKNYQSMPDSMKAEILKQAKGAATEQARDSLGIGYEMKDSAQNILDKSGKDRTNAMIAAAVKAQHYLSPETQKQLSDVNRQFGGADYIGLSDELFNSAKQKAKDYYAAVEASKYGGELTETQKKLAGKNSKELAQYFMDKAIESRYSDDNKNGTKADEYLAAYQKGEINDAIVLAVLSDKEVTAYDRFGRSAGVTTEMALQAANAHANMKDVTDEDGKVTNSAQDQFDVWLDKQTWTEDQKSAVRLGFYSNSSKTYSYLAEQLRNGNIKASEAKSELTPSYQAGWTHNVKDSGAEMADYVEAIVEYEERPSEAERKAAGYKNTWSWFCDYLNSTDLTQEQKYAIAISMYDYADSTKKKIWDRLR
nr:MAG TPA: nuclease [Bacteriophage sp.]